MPFFSIILPTYNRAALLMNAIRSVIEQEFKDWELIIVDDGSEDNTAQVVSAFDDRRIRYLSQHNQGRSIARNAGLEMAQGQWICFLDSDEQYLSKHLSELNNAIQLHSNFRVFRTGVQFEIKAKSIMQAFPKEATNAGQIKYLWHYYFVLVNICIESSLAKSFQFVDIELWEDKDYLQKILLDYCFFQIETFTVIVSDHPNRSVRLAYKNKKLIQQYLSSLEEGYKFLKKERPEIAKQIHLQNIQSKALFTQAVNARKNGDFKRYFAWTNSAFKVFPSLKILLKFFRYLIYP